VVGRPATTLGETGYNIVLLHLGSAASLRDKIDRSVGARAT
jgi:hypothetical protein